MFQPTTVRAACHFWLVELYQDEDDTIHVKSCPTKRKTQDINKNLPGAISDPNGTLELSSQEILEKEFVLSNASTIVSCFN